MDCPKCHQKEIVIEHIDDKRKKLKCGACGFFEVRDERNLPMLVEVPTSPRSALNS